MGVLNIESALNNLENNIRSPNANKVAAYCIACKSGYLPLKMSNSGSGIHLNGVYDCVPIGKNCD